MSVDVAAIVAAAAAAVGTRERPLQLHEPRFAGREWDYVKECIDTGWVSSVGKFVDTFEAKLAETCGVKHAIAAVNGTAALQVALHLVGVRSGDEVIIPTLTFIATANAVSYCGGIPHFVDAEERTLGLDAKKLGAHLARIAQRKAGALYNAATGRPIRAIVPVHLFGHPVDIAGLQAVAAEYELPVVEDATESLGSTYRGRPCGGFGALGVLSFNGNKILTTGGGGAILTDDDALAQRAKHLTTTAKLRHKWAFDHDEIGWNYRLPNLNAALGCAQLEQLDGYVSAKRRLAQRYHEAFAAIRDVKCVVEPAGTASNYWLNSILLADDAVETRDQVLQATHDAGLMTRPAWTPMHRLPMYKDCPRDDLTVSESIDRRLVNLPSSVVLGLQRAAGE